MINFRNIIKYMLAYKDYLDRKFNVKCVYVNGKYIIVDRCCSNCINQKTTLTKNCEFPSSLGCEENWEYLKDKKQ